MNTVQGGENASQTWMTLGWSAALWHPSTLLLLAANAIPIYGALYWGWDLFLLLMLYWLETAVIGFWTIVRIIMLPPESFGDIARPGTRASPTLVAAFFVLHSGIFMAGYVAFLWSEYSGEWSKIVHGPVDFASKLIIDTGLWIPLLVLFIVRGLGFLFNVARPEIVENIARRYGLQRSFKTPAPRLGTVIGDFYTRIIIMQLTILACGFLANRFGTVTPLVLMIAMKTVADGILQVKFDFGSSQKVATTG